MVPLGTVDGDGDIDGGGGRLGTATTVQTTRLQSKRIENRK